PDRIATDGVGVRSDGQSVMQAAEQAVAANGLTSALPFFRGQPPGRGGVFRNEWGLAEFAQFAEMRSDDRRPGIPRIVRTLRRGSQLGPRAAAAVGHWLDRGRLAYLLA